MKKISSLVGLVFILSIFVGVPIFALAQGFQDVTSGLNSTQRIIDTFTGGIVKSLATLFLSLGLLAFFWGIVQYVWAKRNGDAKGVEGGNKAITLGLIALFVMFSVYGIIKLGQSILFSNSDVSTISIPSFDFKKGNSSNVQIGNQSPTTPGGTNGGSPQQPTPGGTNGGNSTTNCDNFVNGAVCTNSSGQTGTCGDMGNGLRGCIPGNGNSSTNRSGVGTVGACLGKVENDTCQGPEAAGTCKFLFEPSGEDNGLRCLQGLDLNALCPSGVKDSYGGCMSE